VASRWRDTALLRLWAWRRIPLLAWVRPRIVERGPERAVICVPLTRRTRNHLGSMYFGALCTGADAAAAMPALEAVRSSDMKWSILFKDIEAQFLRRAEGDVHFTFTQGRELAEVLARAGVSFERENLSISIPATVPALSGDEPVALFKLTLSVKRRSDF
jgi:acyl-coenzyme A thioesterase PaaI-like protein